MPPLLPVPALIRSLRTAPSKGIVLVGGADHCGLSGLLSQYWRQKGAPWNGLCPPLLYRWGAVTDSIPEPPVMGHLSTCVIITLSPDCNGLICKQLWGFLRELRHLRREYFPIHCDMSVKGYLAEGGGRPGTRVGHCYLCHLGSRNSSSLLPFLVEGLTC